MSELRRARGSNAVTMGGILALVGCTTPTQHYDALAQQLHLTALEYASTHFRHRVYANRAFHGEVAAVHVYLEHDGQPWKSLGQPHPDPTPRQPVALFWVAKDPHPAVLIGRPGYHGLDSPTISPWLWTHGRYGTQVVESLAEVIAQLPSVTALIGHSGGGTLAMLVTGHHPAVLSDLRQLVTVAANFDHRAWTAHFGYSPLVDSLDPLDLPPLPPTLRQLHWLAGRDEQVLPSMTKALARTQPTAQWRIQPTFGHQYGWATLLPTVLLTP